VKVPDKLFGGDDEDETHSVSNIDASGLTIL
jgi:hypothetical protein